MCILGLSGELQNVLLGVLGIEILLKPQRKEFGEKHLISLSCADVESSFPSWLRTRLPYEE